MSSNPNATGLPATKTGAGVPADEFRTSTGGWNHLHRTLATRIPTAASTAYLVRRTILRALR